MYSPLALLPGAILASFCVAAPFEKRAVAAPPVSLTDILNYALTLEYLERRFYMEGLSNYTVADFTAAGFSTQFHNNLLRVYEDEKAHVTFIESNLRPGGIREPTFAFPVRDVHSFVGLAAVLEGVGVSAYLGAVGDIPNKEYQGAANSIMTVEARHASYIRDALGQKPFPAAFDTTLGYNHVFSLAAQFITSFAPGTNVPFKAFPRLTVGPSEGGYCAGSTITFKEAHKKALEARIDARHTKVYAVFYSGLQTYYVQVKTSPGSEDYTAVIPGANLNNTDQPATAGQIYVVLSTADNVVTNATDENMIAGVGIFEVTC